MCRLLGYCARGDVSVAGLLGEAGLSAFSALSALHGDGWGMAWYERDEPRVVRSPQRAIEEAAYRELAHTRLGGLGLVHLRWATPGLGIGEHNSHPFRYGRYVFAHNGAIHPQERLGEILPAGWERRRGGSTDSERYFLHIMAGLAARSGDPAAADPSAAVSDTVAAISDTVAAISDTAAHIGRLLRPNSLNAILLSPTALYAICWHYPDRLPVAELRKRGHARSDAEAAAYFDLAYRASEEAVVVASSGWPQDGWLAVPNRHVLVVERATLRTSIEPLAGSADTTRSPGRPPGSAAA